MQATPLFICGTTGQITRTASPMPLTGVGGPRYAPLFVRHALAAGMGRKGILMTEQGQLSATQETLLKTFVARAHGSAEPFVIAAINDGHGEARFGTSGDQRDDFAQDTAISDLEALERHGLIFISKDANANLIFMLTPKAGERYPDAARNEAR